MSTPPQGFTRSARSSAFLELLGPLYEAGSGPDYKIGLFIEERHANTHNNGHGGVSATLLDVFMGRLALLQQAPPRPGVTAQMSIDYLSAVPIGAWLAASGVVDKRGKQLCHVTGFLHANGKLVARATGIFQILTP
jgi:acyl-coenzyme A thioesterase 13